MFVHISLNTGNEYWGHIGKICSWDPSCQVPQKIFFLNIFSSELCFGHPLLDTYLQKWFNNSHLVRQDLRPKYVQYATHNSDSFIYLENAICNAFSLRNTDIARLPRSF